MSATSLFLLQMTEIRFELADVLNPDICWYVNNWLGRRRKKLGIGVTTNWRLIPISEKVRWVDRTGLTSNICWAQVRIQIENHVPQLI